MGKISSLKPLKLFEMTLYCNVPCLSLLPKMSIENPRWWPWQDKDIT
jgi:hypothetical protein